MASLFKVLSIGVALVVFGSAKLPASDMINQRDLSPPQQAAQENFSALPPTKLYTELTYNPAPLKSQVNLKKPKNMDRIKAVKVSKEELVIKRALSTDKKPENKLGNNKTEKETADSTGEQPAPLVDVPLAPGATLNMAYRYLDYNKADLPTASITPRADCGKLHEGHDLTAHEISFEVKIDLD